MLYIVAYVIQSHFPKVKYEHTAVPIPSHTVYMVFPSGHSTCSRELHPAHTAWLSEIRVCSKSHCESHHCYVHSDDELNRKKNRLSKYMFIP